MSSGQCDADRQARKEDSQALVFATKIFLVLQLAVLPGMWLWLQKKNPLFQREPPSSPGKGAGGVGGHRRTAEGAFQDGAAKVASSFKGPRMYTAHGSPGVCCEIARHLEEARREERTREQRREMRREEQQRGSCSDGVPGRRPAALSDFKCPSCEIAVSNANNLTACLRPTLPSTASPFIPLSPSSYHEARRLGLPQKARRTKPSTTKFRILPVGQ